MKTTEERFLAKFRMPMFEDGCWLWEGGLTGAGYSSLGVGGRNVAAHRWAYGYLVGPVPKGLHLDHLCRNRRCVNPAHMEPVTCRENVLRGDGRAAAFAKQTHCLRGHEFTPANTRWAGRIRHCRACKRMFSARGRLAKKIQKTDRLIPSTNKEG